VVAIDLTQMATLTCTQLLGALKDYGNREGLLRACEINIKGEAALKTAILNGIGVLHESLRDSEVEFIKKLYRQNILKVLVVTVALTFVISDLRAHLVLAMDTSRHEGNGSQL